MAFNVEGIKEYVNETKNGLIRNENLGAPTIKYLTLQTGVVGPTTLNLLSTEVTLGDGSVCSFDPSGDSIISQRKLIPALLKVDKEWCDKALAKYFLNQEVRVAAGQATLPAEQQLIEDTIAGTKDAVEKFIWNEDNVIGGAHYKGFLGYKEEMTQAVKGDTIYASMKAVHKAIPAKVLKDTIIFTGIDQFRDLVSELTDKNLFHYDPKIDENFEMILPGTITKVVGVPGLDGKNAIVALHTPHSFFGVDMANDEEVIKVWYSDDDQSFKYHSEFAASVQVAIPTNNVYCNLGA